MRTLSAAVAVAALCGCGNAALSDRFTGTWDGSLMAIVGGSLASTSITQRVIGLYTRGYLVDIAMASDCDIQGVGDADRFSLNFAHQCPKTLDECPSTVLTFEIGTGVLSDDGTLLLELGGQSDGCGASNPFLWAFSGTKKSQGG